LRDVQDTETLYMLGESVVPPHEISLFPLDEEMARDPFYKSNDELGIAPRREEPQRSQNDQDVPRYLRPLDARLGKNFVRTVAMSAEKAGPLKELKEEFPVLPLREDVPVDIPYLDPTQRFPEETTVADGNAPGGFRVIGPPHGKFQIPSRLPGGYELVAYNPSKRKVLIGFGEAGYVLFDRDFAALFGDEGMVSDFIGETEQSVEFRHDHALALVLGRVVLEVAVNSLMFLGSAAGGLSDDFLGAASTEIATGDALGEGTAADTIPTKAPESKIVSEPQKLAETEPYTEPEAVLPAAKRKPPVQPSAPATWRGTLNAFGQKIGWPAAGKIKVPAESADLATLRNAGITEQWAVEQEQVYREVARLNPTNPTAALRAEWLGRIAVRLRGAP
jgi:hypothetical protein